MGHPIAIEVRNVSKRYSDDPGLAPALDNVSVDIADNEFFTLLGPSGCGKTTLLRTIAGFEHVSEGEIRLAGEPVNDLPPFKRRVNTVFQSYALFPHMSVAQNIAFGLEMQGLDRKLIPQRVDEMLALVQMQHLAKRKPAELSGGQQQRVALARALAPKPKVLLLDEPLSALDLKLRKEMQVELKRVQKEAGITFIFVTHDQEEALTLSDRIAVMSAGKILQIGTPNDIYERPQHQFVAQFIGDINFLPGHLKRGQHNEKLFVPNGMPVEIPCPAQGFDGSKRATGVPPGAFATGRPGATASPARGDRSGVVCRHRDPLPVPVEQRHQGHAARKQRRPEPRPGGRRSRRGQPAAPRLPVDGGLR